MALTTAGREGGFAPLPHPGPSAAMPPALELEGLSKRFAGDRPAVDSVSLSIQPGEFFTVLGPSGCGKTTLLRLIAGFEAQSSGRILLQGTSIDGLSPNRRPINVVLQNSALFPHMDVRANIGFGLTMLGWSPERVAARVDAMLGLVRLHEQASSLPGRLSAAQCQWAALARALAPEPALILLDEPLAMLDEKLRQDMQLEWRHLQRETGQTFVLLTRDKDKALGISDRLAVMAQGRIQQVGTPRELYDQPATRLVATIVGEANIIAGPLLGKPEGTIAVVRPERISLVAVDASRIRAFGTVRACSFLGADTLYEIEIRPEIVLRARIRGGPDLERGAEVAVDWPEYAQQVIRDQEA